MFRDHTFEIGADQFLVDIDIHFLSRADLLIYDYAGPFLTAFALFRYGIIDWSIVTQQQLAVVVKNMLFLYGWNFCIGVLHHWLRQCHPSFFHCRVNSRHGLMHLMILRRCASQVLFSLFSLHRLHLIAFQVCFWLSYILWHTLSLAEEILISAPRSITFHRDSLVTVCVKCTCGQTLIYYW